LTYFLPSDYNIQQNHTHFLDEKLRFIYQPDVYQFAIFVARRCGASRIIDIGCGSGEQLLAIADEFEILGVDCEASMPLFRATLPNAKWLECDLESTTPEIPDDMFESAVLICADVIEHLRCPDRLAKYLSRVSEIVDFIFMSTPDRDRARGWLDCGPPDNPSHVIEWSASEFLRFLRFSGFSEKILYGHTVNNNHNLANTMLLAIGGKAAYPRGQFKALRVAAVIHCFNEVDIISEVVHHLVRQGVQIHLFDNWSTDGTWELSSELMRQGCLASLERYPDEPTNEYQWATLLKHTENIAQTIDADWIIHYDADELRFSPWQNSTLVEGISWVDTLGYNAIDFTVLDFRFLVNQSNATAPYEHSLTQFQFGRRPGHFLQVKAWKNQRKVNLVNSGGHNADFEGRRLFPFKFLTKHYPLRNAHQAKKKVYVDRLPRIQLEQAERGWHTHYDQFVGDNRILGWSRSELLSWSEHFFHTEYLVQRLSGIGLED